MGTLMFVVLVSGFAGPVAVFVTQLLMMRPLTRRLLPKWSRPYDDEGRQARAQTLRNVLQGPGNLDSIVKKFDTCDFKRFNNMLCTSSATVGYLEQPKAFLSPTGVLRKTLVKHMPEHKVKQATDNLRDET